MDSNFGFISNLETKALEFAKNGKYKESEDLYRYLIELGSQNSVVYTNLAALCKLKVTEVIIFSTKSDKFRP